MSVASLPMYDFPELRAETDCLWAALREACRARGIDAPDALERGRDLQEVWTDPGLVLSQTCGMPYRLGLHREVTLIGAPDYGVEGCPPGFYNSALVVGSDDARESVADFVGATVVFNQRDSQSGYAAMLSVIPGEDHFATWLETGGHVFSIRAVADGRAAIAAIDAVTWRLAQRYVPEAIALRVLTATDPTPGLPYITAKKHDAGVMAEAVEVAFAALDASAREALGIEGFVRFAPEDYLGVG